MGLVSPSGTNHPLVHTAPVQDMSMCRERRTHGCLRNSEQSHLYSVYNLSGRRNKFCHYLFRASDISRSCRPAKFRYFREIPRNSKKKREIRQKYFKIHVGKTYLLLILAIRPVLFTPNIQIYLETSSLQRVNNVPKLPGFHR